MSVSALWGSVGVERNIPEDIWYAAGLLVSELLEKNALMGADVVSVQFTATMDLDAAYPGEALRELGRHQDSRAVGSADGDPWRGKADASGTHPCLWRSSCSLS